MKILVLNCGSSSLKYQLINMETEEVLASGKYERIGEDEAFITHKVNGQKTRIFTIRRSRMYLMRRCLTPHSGCIGEPCLHLKTGTVHWK